MVDLLPNAPDFLSDLLAGSATAAIFYLWAVLTAKVFKSRRWQRILIRLRRLGWPLVASVFFASALTSAVVRGGTVSIVILTILLTITAITMLLRFGPTRLYNALPAILRPPATFVRSYPWRILFSIFFITTITLLALNLANSSSPGSVNNEAMEGEIQKLREQLEFYRREMQEARRERVVFVVSLDDTELLAFRGILDDVESELGADIFLMNVASGRFISRLDNMVAANDMKWDLIAADNNMLGLLAAKGLVEEVPPEARPVLYPDTLMLSLLPIRSFGGSYYFVPFRPNVKITYYNSAKLEDAGLDPPRTWDELLEVAENGGRVAIQGHEGPAAAVTLYEFVKAAGGNPLTLDDEGSIKAVSFLQNLAPHLSHEYTTTQFDTANELLIDDQAYLVDNWTFGIQAAVVGPQKWEIQAYSGWRGPAKEVHVLGGDVLAVPRGAPHADLAIRLMELLVSKETQKVMRDRLTWMPVRLDAYEGAPHQLQPYFDAVRDAFSSAETRPTEPQWTLAEGILDEVFQRLVVGGEDISRLQEYSAELKSVPTDYVRYEVQDGDTMESVAAAFHTSPELIAKWNRSGNPGIIGPGQILLVPSDG